MWDEANCDAAKAASELLDAERRLPGPAAAKVNPLTALRHE
jgi:hypothetical protein